MIFLCITGAFQPSMHALAWPIAVAVCCGRAAVAWSRPMELEPLPRPVGARPRARKPLVAEKSQQTEVKMRLDFQGLELDAEWREKLLEHLTTEHDISKESCEQLQISFNEGQT